MEARVVSRDREIYDKINPRSHLFDRSVSTIIFGIVING